MTVRTVVKEVECDSCGKKREFRHTTELTTWRVFQASRFGGGFSKQLHTCSIECALKLFTREIAVSPSLALHKP